MKSQILKMRDTNSRKMRGQTLISQCLFSIYFFDQTVWTGDSWRSAGMSWLLGSSVCYWYLSFVFSPHFFLFTDIYFFPFFFYSLHETFLIKKRYSLNSFFICKKIPKDCLQDLMQKSGDLTKTLDWRHQTSVNLEVWERIVFIGSNDEIRFLNVRAVFSRPYFWSG